MRFGLLRLSKRQKQGSKRKGGAGLRGWEREKEEEGWEGPRDPREPVDLFVCANSVHVCLTPGRENPASKRGAKWLLSLFPKSFKACSASHHSLVNTRPCR